MKKFIKISLIVILVIWCICFITDYIRCGNLESPIFVACKYSYSDGINVGTCYGLGYTVTIEKDIVEYPEIKIYSVNMKVFGKTVSASIE